MSDPGYRGYKSYSYLAPVEDYEVFDLAASREEYLNTGLVSRRRPSGPSGCCVTAW